MRCLNHYQNSKINNVRPQGYCDLYSLGYVSSTQYSFEVQKAHLFIYFMLHMMNCLFAPKILDYEWDPDGSRRYQAPYKWKTRVSGGRSSYVVNFKTTEEKGIPKKDSEWFPSSLSHVGDHLAGNKATGFVLPMARIFQCGALSLSAPSASFEDPVIYYITSYHAIGSWLLELGKKGTTLSHRLTVSPSNPSPGSWNETGLPATKKANAYCTIQKEGGRQERVL